MRRAWFLFALAACSSPPMQPFADIPNWTSPPDDGALVRTIVGTGGSAEARAEAESVTRDLVLPTLRKRADLAALSFALASLRRGYELEKESQPRDAFVRFAVFTGLEDVQVRAAGLAEARIAHDLWPGQPLPEEWEDSGMIDPATVPRAASALAERLADIERRYRDRVPLAFSDAPIGTAEFASRRILALARNNLHVAQTGDYTTTSGSIHSVLVARGIATMQLPLDHPY